MARSWPSDQHKAARSKKLKFTRVPYKSLLQPQAKQLFARVELTPAGNTPAAFRQQVVTEFGFWKKFATRAGISEKL